MGGSRRGKKVGVGRCSSSTSPSSCSCLSCGSAASGACGRWLTLALGVAVVLAGPLSLVGVVGLPSHNAWVCRGRGGGWSAARTMGFEDSAASAASDNSTSSSNDANSRIIDAEDASAAPPPGVVCKDGVCEMPALGTPLAPVVVNQNEEEGSEEAADLQVEASADVPEELIELVKMGWDEAAAAKALAEHGNDVAQAAEALADAEERDLERWSSEIQELGKKGWDEDSCLAALRGADGDVTAAVEALEAEDLAVNLQFEESVEDMVGAGWDEDVARQALLLQWQKDIDLQSSRGQGGLGRNRMQLERAAQSVAGGASILRGAGSARKPSASPKKKAEEGPPKAPRESVVFEVTEDSFQAVVLESPVPCLVDVYADWCGPCKQLTPALEEAAMRSGGAFRLVKINSDTQRGLAEVLKVQALPSVFAFRDGRILDNFVGMPDQTFMQQFMMGLLMPPKASVSQEGVEGEEPLRDGQLSLSERRRISFRLQHMAGMAELGIRRKEAITSKVQDALNSLGESSAGAEEEHAAPSPEDSVRLVCKLCLNSISNIHDAKFRRISQTSKAYQSTLLPHPGSIDILRMAGFREQEGNEGFLSLKHRNVAVLSLVRDLCEKWLRTKKAPPKPIQKVAAAADHVEQPLETSRADAPTVASSPPAVAPADTQRKPQTATLHVTMPGLDAEAVVLTMSSGDLLSSVFDELGVGVKQLSTRFSPKAFTREEHGMLTLQEAGLVPSARLIAASDAVQEEPDSEDSEEDSEAAQRQEEARQKRREAMRAKAKVTAASSKKTGSLWGDGGIAKSKKKKGVEHFGGDSTVTLAVEESEEEEEEEKDGNSNKSGQDAEDSEGKGQDEGDAEDQ